jgi:hypothetical protein
MGKMSQRLLMTVAGTVTTRAVRRVTRKALHQSDGAPRLPRRVKRSSGLGTSLAWMAGAAAAMALAELCAEQARRAAPIG